jgi:diguanylate cyclase (GGDEF)-like protein
MRFEERVEMGLRRTEREYYQVAIVVLDGDRFKLIDGSWGQAAGDGALDKISSHIEAHLRAADPDNEFMLAFVRADASSVESVVTHVRKSLDTVEIGPVDESRTFGAGISKLPGHAADLPELAPLADCALYWGNDGGRGRWSLYPAGSASPIQTLQALAKSIDAKNRFTGGHCDRVASFAVALAESLGFEEDRVADLRQAALLHDIGKIGVREPVLLKEEPPNLEDQAELERHSELGCAMLAGAGMGEHARWIRHLHERFDGRGYPDGLAGRQIPVESRILHAADALDKMTRPHAYRRHRPLREALAELAFGAGTRLDPELAQRLIKLVQSGELKVPGHGPHGRPVRQPATRRVRGATLG